MLKQIKENYYLPTPVLLRKIGDSFLAISTFITTYAIFTNSKTVAIISLISGIIGKFLTNIFAKDPQ